jgi:hypothetical protein
MSFVSIDNKIYTASEEACGCSMFKDYPTIHIFRSDIPKNNCKFVDSFLHASPSEADWHNNLCLDYIDGYRIPEHDLARIAVFAQRHRHEKILIHCHAGRTRSAVVGLFVESCAYGYSPIAAMYKVYNCFYKQTGHLPNITLDPMTSIMEWWE